MNKKYFFLFIIICTMTGCGDLSDRFSFAGKDKIPFGIAPYNHISQHESNCIYSIAGLVSWGDASITSAKEFRELSNGEYPVLRMSRVSHIDIEKDFFWGTGCYKIVANGLTP